jgi:cell shape-determining protein MreD
MKSVAYLILLVLLIPIQTGVLEPLANIGIRPDLGMVFLYAIGLLTGPVEGALAGMALGLLQDISGVGIVGLSGLSRGAAGFVAGLLGSRVLDIGSPSNIVFLAAFTAAESLFIALFFELSYGSMPVWSLLFRRMLPGALFTALAGYAVLQVVSRRQVLRAILRRNLQKEL